MPNQFTDLAECLRLGLPGRDAQRTEEIAMVVVSRESEEMLCRSASETLPAWEAPRPWRFVALLAANERGNISHSEWRQTLLKNPPGRRRELA